MEKVTSSMTFNISQITDQKYICWVNGTTNHFTLNTSSIEVAGLTPNTVYSIGCVEVDEDGHYQCTEYNTTVVTGDYILMYKFNLFSALLVHFSYVGTYIASYSVFKI